MGGYEPFIDIPPFLTLIRLEEFLSGIQHCVTFVGKCIVDSNIQFVLTFSFNKLDK